MGLLGSLLGHASEEDVERTEEALEAVLLDEERVERAYRIVRDLIVFTDRRLILIEKTSGRKTEYHSVPYRSITHFAVGTTGRFDMDAELRIWISGDEEPIEREFKRNRAVVDVQQVLARHVLG